MEKDQPDQLEVSIDSSEVDDTCRETSICEVKMKVRQTNKANTYQCSLVNMNYHTTHVYATICHVCFKVSLNTQVGEHIKTAHANMVEDPLDWNLFYFLQVH